MSVEFRQRTPGEYAQILWRRKWHIALPTVAVALAVAYVVWRLPNVYESTTLLTVRPATISASVAPQLSDNDLSLRINSIGQVVVSRTNLEPLIEKHNLYADERRRGAPMDALVERMRTRDIVVKINTSRNDVTNGFNISFRSSDPRSAQAVTAELASKYVNEQMKAASTESTATKQYFEQRLQQAKEELDAIDQRRLDTMIANKESLPSVTQSLIGQLAGLREQQKSLYAEIGRLRERRALFVSQQGDLDKQREQEIRTISERDGNPKQTIGYVELVKRKAQLESELQQLLSQYTAKHPDVISKKAEIGSVQRQMDLMVSESKERVEQERKRLESLIDPRANTLKYQIQDAESQTQQLQRYLATTETQIADVNRRLGSVPNAEVALEALNREYQSKKAVYDDLLAQEQRAILAADVTANQQGETIGVIDPANLPQRPVAPKRPMLMVMGLMLGLGLGLALAAAREVPRLLTIQTTED
ncbi:MAG TPA: GNVR domain-containing protein, partial [Pyrinomonadaceae bacterium]|nr:GNVR domain-containing protein [Pyrinomonadaceae bacterium]